MKFRGPRAKLKACLCLRTFLAMIPQGRKYLTYLIFVSENTVLMTK